MAKIRNIEKRYRLIKTGDRRSINQAKRVFRLEQSRFEDDKPKKTEALGARRFISCFRRGGAVHFVGQLMELRVGGAGARAYDLGEQIDVKIGLASHLLPDLEQNSLKFGTRIHLLGDFKLSNGGL